MFISSTSIFVPINIFYKKYRWHKQSIHVLMILSTLYIYYNISSLMKYFVIPLSKIGLYIYKSKSTEHFRSSQMSICSIYRLKLFLGRKVADSYNTILLLITEKIKIIKSKNKPSSSKGRPPPSSSSRKISLVQPTPSHAD